MVKNDAVQPIYKCVDNPVTVQVDHYKPSELTIKVSTGTVIKTNDSGSYNWKVFDCQDKVATVKIYCHNQFIKSIKFHLKRIPDPVAMIGPHEGSCRGGFPKIQKQEGIRAELRDFIFEGIQPNVMSFHVTIKKANYNGIKDTILIADNKGALFNPQVKKMIESLEPGDTVMFDKIMVLVGCEASLRAVKNIVFNLY